MDDCTSSVFPVTLLFITIDFFKASICTVLNKHDKIVSVSIRITTSVTAIKQLFNVCMHLFTSDHNGLKLNKEDFHSKKRPQSVPQSPPTTSPSANGSSKMLISQSKHLSSKSCRIHSIINVHTAQSTYV